MQALIKAGTESNPIWGFIRHSPSGWNLVESKDKPTVFLDESTMEIVNDLTHGQASEKGFKLVTINISIKQ